MTSHGPEKSFDDEVAKVLASLPAGEVMAYGEVASEAGFPGAARAVGNFLRRTEDQPWWRIVTADGRLVPGHEERQERLLRQEGVTVKNGRVTATA